MALNNATLPYVLALANKGWVNAARSTLLSFAACLPTTPHSPRPLFLSLERESEIISYLVLACSLFSLPPSFTLQLVCWSIHFSALNKKRHSHRENKELSEGLNIACGTIVHPGVHSDYPAFPYIPVDLFLDS